MLKNRFKTMLFNFYSPIMILVVFFLLIKGRPNPMEYTYTDESITIKSKNESLIMNITFKPCGANDIVSIDEIKLSNNKDTFSVKSCTDWIGPYMVKDLTSTNDIGEQQFTGGWHSFENNGIQEPTARTINFEVMADGNEVKGSGHCKVLKIIVTNQIKSYNTKEFVLEENVEYVITKSKIDVRTTITSLDQVVIERYYGLQTQNTNWNDSIEYCFASGESYKVNAKGKSESGISLDYPNGTAYILTSKETPFSLKAWIKQDSPLTKYQYLSSDKPCMFTMDYEKSYFNLVNGKILELEKGNTVIWSGGYVFY